jgi:hypothetical protein
MVSKIKIALIAGIAAAGIATPAFAQSAGPTVYQYSLPSEAPGYGAVSQNRPTVARDRALYDSANAPGVDNWGSTTGRQGTGR